MGCSLCRFFFKMKEEGGVYPSLGKEVNGVGVFIAALQSTSSKIKSPATTASCSCSRRRGHGAPGAARLRQAWARSRPAAPLPSAARASFGLIYRNSRFNLRWAPGPGAAQRTGSACPAAAASRARQMSTFVPNKRVIVSAKLPSHCL